MQATSFPRVARTFSGLVFCLALAGCFGTGDGPEPIPGTPAPPPDPSTACDPLAVEPDGSPFPLFFERDGASYDFGVDAGFGGGATVVVENPVCRTDNPSPQVARMQKFAAEIFGGSTLTLSQDVDFSQGEVFTMKVWSERSVPVTFKFEDATTPPGQGGIEVIETHTGNGGEWQTLCFDFGGVVTPGYQTNALTLIFDATVLGNADNDPDNWTFYMDAIEQVDVCPGAPTTTLPVDFEDAPAEYQFSDFAGGVADVITNPDQSGLNTTTQTARMRKSSGEIFGGSTLALADDVDFTQGTAFTMKVWSNRGSAVPVLFKFEDAITGLPNNGIELTETHTGGGTWEELCYDFGAATNGFTTDSITFIFDPTVVGDADNDPDGWTFYFDEIQQVASCGGTPPPPPAALPVLDFETPATGAGFTWEVFENDDNPGIAFIPNPDQSGANTSATVAEFTARVGGQPFAGTATEGLPTFTLDASNAIVKLKVWKPVISNVGIKFETASGASTGEILVANTVTNQWEELTFDFTSVIGNPANTDITKVVIFPDFDTRAQENVIYFDDLSFGDGSPPPSSLPTVDFESPSTGATYTWDVFENGDNPGVAIITNPDQSGINTSATVAEFTARVAGQPFAGTVTRDLPTFTLDASNAIVKLKVWKPVISNVGIKFERDDNASTGEILVANTVTNQWEELTFDFTSVIGNGANTDITKVVIFPDFDARTQENVIYFDDLSFGDGSAPPPPPPPTSAPPLIDFESGSLTFNDFDGGMSMLAANPDTSGINPSATVLQLQKFAGADFGGTTILLPGLVDFANGEAYSINVYATRTVDVLFKLEGPNLEQTVTHGGTGWETLCFDFTGSADGTDVDGYTFIFDNGTQGDAANNPDDWTFFVDDIEQVDSCGGGTVTLPIVDFESAAGGTGFTWEVFENVENPALQFIANPDPTGANTSSTVAEFTARVGGATFAGTVTGDLPTFTLDASNAIVTLKVWKSVISDVGVKFETASGASTGEVLVSNTVTDQWEELTFDFTSVIGDPANTDITRVVIFPDFDARTQDNVIYFDDLQFSAAPPPPPPASLPLVDFESPAGGTGFTWEVFENDDNPGVAFLPNPDTSGINPSATAAQFTARVGGQPFAGTVTEGLPTFTLDPTNAVVKLKVFKPVVSNVGVKFETASGASTGEVLVANTVVNQWEELTFDFSAVIGDPANTDITRIVIFPDFEARTQQNVIYFDDLEFTDGSAPPPPPPTTAADIDFESPGTGAGFTWSVFENDDNPGLAILPNPDPSGINTSATVAQFTARLAGQPFAGTITNDLPTFTLDSSNAIVKIMVYKSVISDVGIKFENATQGSTGEIRVPNTVVNQWEELTFDFTGVIGNPVNTDITGFIVFPDFDTRTQQNVVYFDNVRFGDGT